MVIDCLASQVDAIVENRFRLTDTTSPLRNWLFQAVQRRLREQASGTAPFPAPIEVEPRLVMPHLRDAPAAMLCLSNIDSILPRVKLPSFPQVFYTLQEMGERDDVTMEQMGQVICLDPKMTCSLLKLANGSLLKHHSSIDTVARAIEVLLLCDVSTQTLGTLMLGLFCERSPACLNIELFCQHSIAVGIVARELAKRAGRNEPERYYVAGLVHDIGWLALTCTEPEMAMLALEKADEWLCPFVQAEQRALGFDHAQLGARLLELWSFPPNLIAAAEYHHAPSECSAYDEPVFVHLADVIVKAVGYGASADCLVQPLDSMAWEALGVEPDVLSEIIDELDREIAFLERSLCMV